MNVVMQLSTFFDPPHPLSHSYVLFIPDTSHEGIAGSYLGSTIGKYRINSYLFSDLMCLELDLNRGFSLLST